MLDDSDPRRDGRVRGLITRRCLITLNKKAEEWRGKCLISNEHEQIFISVFFHCCRHKCCHLLPCCCCCVTSLWVASPLNQFGSQVCCSTDWDSLTLFGRLVHRMKLDTKDAWIRIFILWEEISKSLLNYRCSATLVLNPGTFWWLQYVIRHMTVWITVIRQGLMVLIWKRVDLD